MQRNPTTPVTGSASVKKSTIGYRPFFTFPHSAQPDSFQFSQEPATPVATPPDVKVIDNESVCLTITRGQLPEKDDQQHYDLRVDNGNFHLRMIRK